MTERVDVVRVRQLAQAAEGQTWTGANRQILAGYLTSGRVEALCNAIDTLERIAGSYAWEPYEDDETIIASGVVDGRVVHDEHPTNRRLAREALRVLSGGEGA